MLKHVTVTVLIIYELYFAILCDCMGNNVCKTYKDYRTVHYNPNCWRNPDIDANPSEIAKRYGFPFESYEITTQDGYIVSLFRVPHNGSDVDKKRPVVFLQHGITADSRLWMMLGLKSSVFVFANNGYDVWISNSRGSQYSSKHIKYTVHDPQYWNFSFHELAVFDVPAMLDFIAEKTGQAGRITYVGFSMGTTMSFIYASLMPQSAEKHLKSIIALAPVVYLDHVRSPIALVTFTGLRGFGPNMPQVMDSLKIICSTYPLIKPCQLIVQLLLGTNKYESLPSNFPMLFSGLSGYSFKTFLHYGQMLAGRRFQFYSYGCRLNRKFYNSSMPPKYPLSEIKIPVHLFYGKNDFLADPQDAVYLYDKLTTEKTEMEVFNFAHDNFCIGVHTFNFYQFLLNYL